MLVDKFLAAVGLNLCLHCGSACPQGSLCERCLPRLPTNTASCWHCGVPLAQAAPCLECQRSHPPWTSCTTPWRYEPPLSGWLHTAKFREDCVALRALCQLAETAALPKVDLICPIPMPLSRLRSRGINLAAELARHLSRRQTTPWHHGLQCVHAPQQRGHNREHRLQADINRYSAPQINNGQRVLLVDDVMTTGATLRAATNCLLSAGAVEVHVFALLRTARRRPTVQPQP